MNAGTKVVAEGEHITHAEDFAVTLTSRVAFFGRHSSTKGAVKLTCLLQAVARFVAMKVVLTNVDGSSLSLALNGRASAQQNRMLRKQPISL